MDYNMKEEQFGCEEKFISKVSIISNAGCKIFVSSDPRIEGGIGIKNYGSISEESKIVTERVSDDEVAIMVESDVMDMSVDDNSITFILPEMIYNSITVKSKYDIFLDESIITENLILKSLIGEIESDANFINMDARSKRGNIYFHLYPRSNITATICNGKSNEVAFDFGDDSEVCFASKDKTGSNTFYMIINSYVAEITIDTI